MRIKFQKMLAEGHCPHVNTSDSTGGPNPPRVDSDVESVDENANTATEEAPPRHEESTSMAVEAIRIHAESKYVEITNMRLFTIADLELTKLTHCECLSLRKNLIHVLTPLPLAVASRLHELDFFDNKIKKIGDFFQTVTVEETSDDNSSDQEAESPTKEIEPKESVTGPLIDCSTATGATTAAEPAKPSVSDEESVKKPHLTKKSFVRPYGALTKLDFSYNQLRHVTGLDSLAPTLKELYLVENKLKVVEGLDKLVNLELLELGGNRLRKIDTGLENLVNLRQLWLGKNKIVRIGKSLHQLHKLELLSLQANRILTLEPDNFPNGVHTALREVYLSENGIQVIEHLEHLHTLRTLDLSFNPIAHINEAVINVTTMPVLHEFWLTDGKINLWDEVGKLACFSTTLRTVYLERNPIEQDKRYRDKVYLYLPFVTQIDSWPVINKDNLEADRTIERRNPRD